MARALPSELRERALEAREREGLSIAETAARFMVGTASVKRWNRRMKSTGSVAPSPVGGVRRIWIGEDDRTQLVELVEKMPDATIEELRAEYNSRHGSAVSSSAMHRALQRFDLTRKKSPSTRPRRRPSV
ncbi:MAG: IS630 transposase-related protein [Accumulibacter sp.]|uniref:IS630 transposase-related protein n=1 Tax=Accumulibacter sp. TaxID=2053492 RepID=UPI003315E44E